MCPINFQWEETYTPTLHSGSLTLAPQFETACNMNLITRCACVRCRKSGGAARRPHTSPSEGTLWSCYHISGGARPRSLGPRRAWLLDRGDRGWATAELRLNNYDYRARPGPGLRRTAVATAAERLSVCACRARETACLLDEPPDPGEQQRRL